MPRAPVVEPAPSPLAGLLAGAIGPNDANIPPNAKDPAHEPKAKRVATAAAAPTPAPEPVNEPPPLTETLPPEMLMPPPDVKERPDFPYAPFVVLAFDALVKSLGWGVFGEGNKTTMCAQIPVAYRRVCHLIERGPNGDRRGLDGKPTFPSDEEWRVGSFGS